MLERVKKLNRLDMILYERAVELLEARYQDMVHREIGEKERFVPYKNWLQYSVVSSFRLESVK